MLTFDHIFTVRAPLQRVAEFHHHPRALKLLCPPPLLVQLHQADPVANGSLAEFTLWFGPVPVRWRAVHSSVTARGFTDTQTSGPLRHWAHTHSFEALSTYKTRVKDHIEYDYQPGLAGLFSRLIFAPFMLRMLFTYRAWVTRKALEK